MLDRYLAAHDGTASYEVRPMRLSGSAIRSVQLVSGGEQNASVSTDDCHGCFLGYPFDGVRAA